LVVWSVLVTEEMQSQINQVYFLALLSWPTKCHMQNLNRKYVFHQLVEGPRLVEPSLWVCLIVDTHNTIEQPNALPANLPFLGLHLI